MNYRRITVGFLEGGCTAAEEYVVFEYGEAGEQVFQGEHEQRHRSHTKLEQRVHTRHKIGNGDWDQAVVNTEYQQTLCVVLYLIGSREPLKMTCTPEQLPWKYH